MPSSDIKPHTNCRVCGGIDLVVYCGLGEQPLANELLPLNFCGQEFRAPLEVAHCRTCGLSQLTVVVSPERLYKNYPFRSGVNAAWLEHCEALAREIRGPRFVVDIGANDGVQLRAFERRGAKVLGIDPAGIESETMLPWSWSAATASTVKQMHGQADVIIAQNVFGHVDNVHDFLDGIELLLAPGGVCVIEVPDMPDGLVPALAFDTVYHEHLSYWSEHPLRVALARHDLTLVNAEPLAVHGGSKRYWISAGIEAPDDYIPPPESVYAEFGTILNAHLRNIHAKLQGVVAGKRLPLWAYGASAKGTVMLNALQNAGNGIWPDYIVDDAPSKQGKRVPGVRIPIIAPQDLAHVRSLWILSWNWIDLLQQRAEDLGFRGMYL